MSEESNIVRDAIGRVQRFFSTPVQKTIGTCAAAATLWFGYLGFFAAPELSYSVQPSRTQIAVETSRDDGLISTSFLTDIQLKNSGLKLLEASAFTDEFPPYGSGLVLSAENEQCNIRGCGVSEMHPAERQEASLKPIDKGKIFVHSIALNPGDSFSIQVISDKNPKSFKIFGHLNNCKIQRVDASYWNCWNAYLFLGATAGIAALLLEVYCYFQLLEFVKWLTKRRITKSLAVYWILYRELRYWWKVRAHAKTPDRANQILTKNSEFDRVASEIGANTAEEREKLRKALADIINPPNTSATQTSPGDGSRSATASDANSESPVTAARHADKSSESEDCASNNQVEQVIISVDEVIVEPH